MKKRLAPWGESKVLPVVSCLVVNTMDEVLLLQRHSADLGGGKWGTPGGRIEPAENPYAAAVRELREETGIDALECILLGAHELHMPHGKINLTTFRINVVDSTNVVLDPDEHTAYRWFDLNNIVTADDMLWGLPTILRDFDLITDLSLDSTLVDGSKIIFLNRA